MERSMAKGHELVPPFGKVIPNACKKNYVVIFHVENIDKKMV
jgi:hypothetical protein